MRRDLERNFINFSRFINVHETFQILPKTNFLGVISNDVFKERWGGDVSSLEIYQNRSINFYLLHHWILKQQNLNFERPLKFIMSQKTIKSIRP